MRNLREQLRGNVGVMVISWFLFAISSSLTNPYLSLYMKYLGAGPQYIGAAFALAYLVQLITVIPGGMLTDTIGRRRAIVIGTWGITVTSFLYSVAPDWRSLLIIYLVDTAMHFYQPALTAILLDSLPPGRVASGMLLTSILPQLPWLILPPVGGYLIHQYGVLGIRLSFVVSGVVAIIVALLRMRSLSETLSNTTGRPALTQILSSYNLYRTLRGLPREITLVMLIMLLVSAASSSANTLLPIYSVYILGVGTVEYGSLVSISMAASIGLGLLMIARIDRIESGLLSLGLLVQSISSITELLGGRLTLPIYMVSAQVGNQLVTTSLEVIISRKVPRERRGIAVSILTSSQLMGQSIGSYLVSLLYATDPTVIFKIPVVIFTTMLLIVLSRHESLCRRPRFQSESM